MNILKVTLTHEDYTTIMNSGGKITFKPLKGNKLKCNQITRLTRLSKRHVASLRKQFYILKRDLDRSSHTASVSQPKLATSRIDFWGQVQCPGCLSWHRGKKSGQVIACRKFGCTNNFIAID